MNRILVPTDFSPTSEKAFRFALDMAQRAKGTVILYHCYTPVESVFAGPEKVRTLYNTQQETNLVKQLQRLSRKVKEDIQHVPVATVLGRTPVIDNVLGFAESNQTDLIVMGTQGASSLKKALIGSVAARIIERSDIPVLLVPEKYELSTPDHFVFATSFSSRDKAALEVTGMIARLYKGKITVVHFENVLNEPEEREKTKKDFDAYAYFLQREMNEFKIQFNWMDVASVKETMENLDRKIPYDVMVLVRRKKTAAERFFLDSVTQEMAYLTHKPLLVIPEQANESEQ